MTTQRILSYYRPYSLRQSVEAEKNKQQLFDKRFEEALRKAKESPDEGRPLREFDLD